MTDRNEALRLADDWEPRSYEVASMIRQQAERIAELEVDRDQHKATATSLIALLADIRMACGDNGLRMQPELVEFIGAMKAERDQLRAEVERLRVEVSCGNGCACSLQCGDYYAHHGQENPSGNQNTIKNVDGVVLVCPTKDSVCGDRPANWCEACPNQNRIKKPSAGDQAGSIQ